MVVVDVANRIVITIWDEAGHLGSHFERLSVSFMPVSEPNPPARLAGVPGYFEWESDSRPAGR